MGRPASETVAAVRHRPAAYFGEVGPRGLDHVVLALVANAVDAFLAGGASVVDVSWDGAHVRVVDDGAGLPLAPLSDGTPGPASRWFTEPHVVNTADGDAPRALVTGPHGIGLAPVCAVAARLTCTSWREGVAWRQSWTRGVPDGPAEVASRGAGRGTEVSFLADPEIWGDPDDGGAVPRPGPIRGTLFLMAHLFPGLEVRCGRERFLAGRGLADLVQVGAAAGPVALGGWDDPPVFHHHAGDGTLSVQVAAWGTAADATAWRTWANGCETPGGGSHGEGAARAFARAGWTPHTATVHVVLRDVRFAGPLWDRLDIPEVVARVERLLTDAVANFVRRWGLGSDDRA
ncbi:MAG: hypothetical protein H6733_04380 [Alphaproteobacteria bacterium]|nr:hypothetical protein [Alphaproteobacteria bacterium]